MGFDKEICKLIDNCISTATFSILLNGALTGYFKAERGIQQGDPMSPALFTILLDLLSRMINKAADEGRLKYIKVSRTNPRISHLMYADDLVIYGKATT